ncbi:MAG: recombinase family protein [Lachnospiraceae bacterium]
MTRTASKIPINVFAEPTVALYVRVSTGYQVEKDSLPHQKKELTAYCEHVLHIAPERIEIFEDAGKSAKNTKRPAFERMMKKIKAGLVSHVLVYKIDRISRNLVDFSIMYDDFKDNRVAFISLNEQFDTSTAMGECMLKIILVFAELERKITSERVTDIMLGRAKNKLWNGARMPLGFAWDSEKEFPVIHEEEKNTIRLIFDMYEKEQSSCIVRNYLNTHDIKTKRGGEWGSKTVSDIIRNPMYKGTYRYNYRESARGKVKPQEEWIILDDVFPAIIQNKQWELCNKYMNRNAAARGNVEQQHKEKYIHVFGGFLRCGICGSNMTCDKDRKRLDGFFPSNYRCSNQYRKNTCKAKMASDVVIGPIVINYIKNMVHASKIASKISTVEELEQLLLTGSVFRNIAGIDSSGLATTFSMLSSRTSGNVFYRPAVANGNSSIDETKISLLSQERDKNTRALERLKKLFLFDEATMNEKEYLQIKRELEVHNAQIENELAEIQMDNMEESGGASFVASASSFLVAHSLNMDSEINYRELATLVDENSLKVFVGSVISSICIMDSRVESITFKNDVVHKFLYKE